VNGWEILGWGIWLVGIGAHIWMGKLVPRRFRWLPIVGGVTLATGVLLIRLAKSL